MKLLPLLQRTATLLDATSTAALSLLYPPHCASCKVETPPGCHLCTECAAQIRGIMEPFCKRCSQPFDGAIEGPFTCSNCRDRRFHFQCAVSCFRSEKVVREFVHRFKYEGHFHLRHQLADWLEAAFADERLRATPAAFLVPVPLHPARKREREFNQAEVLARLVSGRLGIPVVMALKRLRYTSTQTRLARRERMENLRGAFMVRNTCPVHRQHIILIDDVFTTGSTADECALVLRRAGAASVRVATVARG